MAHRGETLSKDVCCVADLKKLGSSRLAPMVRGEYHEQFTTAIHCTSADLNRLLQWRSYGSNHVRNFEMQRPVHLPNKLSSLNENEAAYDRYKIRPRILINVDKIDTTTEFLGSKVCYHSTFPAQTNNSSANSNT